MEQTDYTSYAPLGKKQVDMNNYGHKEEERNPQKPHTDLNPKEEKNDFNYGGAKQGMLSSAFGP